MALEGTLTRPLAAAGGLFGMFADVARAAVRPPFAWREYVEQVWFIARVTSLPTALVAIPFGAVIALQLGSLTRQLGAQSYTGAASALAIIREASPIATALLIAGAAGTAICADLGARRIRDEIDAMEVLGIDPIQRLVVPRVLAAVTVALLLNGFVAFIGIVGGYFFSVVLQDGSAGSYFSGFATLAQSADLYVGAFKAALFGLLAGVVASYKGLTAKGGAQGVGDAVNASVVLTFLLLFAVNFLVTVVYVELVPPRGG
ncbi:MAG TPA: ABC transporter permease [Mycobacteriales bacterium]|nr:ABC transporter permease [Mycobacteriales bacterium]